MSEPNDRDLEAEARALLRPAKEPLPAPPDVKARALARLLIALPIVGDGGGPAGASEPSAPATRLPSRPPTAAGPPTSALGRAIATRVPAWSLLVSFAAGGAVATVAVRRAAPPSAPVAMGEPPQPPAQPVVASVAPAPAAIAATAPAGTPAQAVPPSAAPAPAARASAGVRPSETSTLEAERTLLDVARTALGRGDGANALRATEAHARTYPRGVLAEEREAIAIQALRLLGRQGDARSRLDRFRARFPTSLIRPALEADDAGAP